MRKLEYRYSGPDLSNCVPGSNNNGNVLSQRISTPGTVTATQVYGYAEGTEPDPANRVDRLTSVSENGVLLRHVAYDRYGSGWVSYNAPSLPLSPLTPAHNYCAHDAVLYGQDGWLSKFKTALAHCPLEHWRERAVRFEGSPNRHGEERLTLSDACVK